MRSGSRNLAPAIISQRIILEGWDILTECGTQNEEKGEGGYIEKRNNRRIIYWHARGEVNGQNERWWWGAALKTWKCKTRSTNKIQNSIAGFSPRLNFKIDSPVLDQDFSCHQILSRHVELFLVFWRPGRTVEVYHGRLRGVGVHIVRVRNKMNSRVRKCTNCKLR